MSPVPNENKDTSEDDHPADNTGIEEEHSSHIIGPVDTDSEDEEGEGEGEDNFGQDYLYQLLPQEPNGVILENYGSDPEDESEPFPAFNDGVVMPSQSMEGAVEGTFRQQFGEAFGHLPLLSVLEVPELPRPNRRDLLWNQPRVPSYTLDDDQSEKIKMAMAGFRLPSSHHPDWAHEVSDDQWKTQLLSRLRSERTDTSTQSQSQSPPTDSSSSVSEAKADPNG